MKNLQIPIAFLLVLLIWTTTPLAIQWSSVGAPLTSLLLRMVIGVMFCLLVMGLMTTSFPNDAFARRVYAIAGLATYIAMALVYIAAQSVPSGWVAVMFGLSPLITGVIAPFVEPENRLTPVRILGISLGLIGLGLVFSGGLSLDKNTLPGIGLLLVAVTVSAGSSVIVRHLSKDNELQPMQITTGSVIVAIPLFGLTAFLVESGVEGGFSPLALTSILYLGIVGTGIGFTAYFFLLKHLPANKVALIMLITPISALLVGNLVNSEPVVTQIWLGAGFVCAGLLLYEYRPRFGLRKL